MNLPACGSIQQFEILSNDKRQFKKVCQKYGVPVPKEYQLSIDFNRDDLDKIQYPVLVKPADESGSRGIRRCSNEKELIENFTWLYNYSKSKKIFVEQYIKSPCELFFDYTIQDGHASLSAGFIKHKIQTEDGMAASAILHMFFDQESRKFVDLYRNTAEAAVLRLIEGLELQNGMLMFQGFLKDGCFYFYESGLRMGGEQFYVFTDQLNDLNALDMMIEFAVTGNMGCNNLLYKDNPVFNKSCCNYYVTLKPGIITSITGLNEVLAMPQVLQSTTFKKIGDEIPKTNSLDRVIYRIHVMDDTPEALAQTLVKISSTLCIKDSNGCEMQAEHLTYDRALSMTANLELNE